MASSVGTKEAKEMSSSGSPPFSTNMDHMMIHHTPMSERQQLALIKKMEKAATAEGSVFIIFDHNFSMAIVEAPPPPLHKVAIPISPAFKV